MSGVTVVGTVKTLYVADSAEYEAKAKRIEASLKRQLDESRKLSASAKSLMGSWESSRAVKAVTAVGDAAIKTRKAVAGLADESTKAQGALSRLREGADRLDDRFGKASTAISGMSSALGVTGSVAGDAVAGVSDLAMSFASGGPLLAGFAAVGVAAAGTTKLLEWQGDQIEALEKHWRQVVEPSRLFRVSLEQQNAALRDNIKLLNQQATDPRHANELAIRAASLKTVEKAERDLAEAVKARAKADKEAAAGVDPRKLGLLDRIGVMFMGTGHHQEKLNNASMAAQASEANAKGAVKEAKGQEQLLLDELEAERRAAEAAIRAAQAQEIAYTGVQRQADALIAAIDLDRELGMADPVPFAGVQDISASELSALGGGGNVDDVVTVISHAAEATADELEAMNADFLSAGEAALDLRSPFEKVADAALDVAGSFDRAAMNVLEATLAGGAKGGGQAAGAMLGGIIDVASGGATGGLGAMLGGMIGGIFGDALDKLIESLGVLSPLFDAVGVIIDALAPVLKVVGELMSVVGRALEGLAPIVLDLARPVAAVVLVVVRLLDAFMPFIGMVLAGAHGMLVWLDGLTLAVKWLDDNFLRPLVLGARMLHNGWAIVVNGMIDWLRDLTGWDDFGTKLKMLPTVIEPLIDNFDELTTEVKKNRDVQGDSANLPPGFRYALAAANAETPVGLGGPAGGVGAFPFPPAVQFLGPVSFSVRGMSGEEIEGKAREMLKKRTGSAWFVAPGRGKSNG